MGKSLIFISTVILSIVISQEAFAAESATNSKHSFAVLNRFYRSMQLQGHLPTQGLVSIPSYMWSGNDLGYLRKPGFAKEIPFVDSFTINRFLGGVNPDRANQINQVFWKNTNITPFTSIQLLDYSVKNLQGQYIYRDSLIKDRIDPYLEQGYRLKDMTLAMDNVPYDYARSSSVANPYGLNGQIGPWGQQNPPDDWNQWQKMMMAFSYHMKKNYPESLQSGQSPNFKFGIEYDSRDSFNGTESDFFNYYYKAHVVFRNNFPTAELMPGEFTGSGICPINSKSHCVYDAQRFRQKASSGQWKVSVVPRSLHGIYMSEPDTAVDPTRNMPDQVVERATASYARLGNVIPEIHQFGLLGQPGTTSGNLSYGSDVGARSANWELQMLMGLKKELNPRRVFHWGGVYSIGGKVHYLNGSGFVRNFLDHQLGAEISSLSVRTNPIADPRMSVKAYAFNKSNEVTLVISTFSNHFKSGTVNVRANFNDYLKGLNLDGKQAEVIFYNQDNNVHAKIRNDLLANGNLRAYFVQNRNSLGPALTMAIDQTKARAMIFKNNPSYEAFARKNLNYIPIENSGRFFYVTKDYFWGKMNLNELLIIRIKL